MSFQKFPPQLFSIVFSLFTFLFLIGYYIFAWTEPTSPPPGGNVLAPINTGSINHR